MRVAPFLLVLVACSEYKFADDPDAGNLGGAGNDGPDASGDDTTTGADDTSDPANDDPGLDGDADTDADGDADTDADSDTDADADTGTDTGGVPEIPDDACDIAAQVDGWLDQYQTPNDGRVHYCHAGSGNYTLVTSDISSCIPHLAHPWDVFPTTLCDS